VGASLDGLWDIGTNYFRASTQKKKSSLKQPGGWGRGKTFKKRCSSPVEACRAGRM